MLLRLSSQMRKKKKHLRLLKISLIADKNVPVVFKRVEESKRQTLGRFGKFM